MKTVVHLCSSGQKKSGVDVGAQQIANAMLRHDIATDKDITYVQQYYKTSSIFGSIGYKNAMVQHNILEQNGTPWLSIGGDHSIAAATIEPILAYNNSDTLIIWVDAHADINNYATSPSKNSHGMPVAYLMGLIEEEKCGLQPPRCKLNPNNILYIGIRDLDVGEIERIDKMNIAFFSNSNDLKLLRGNMGQINVQNIYNWVKAKKLNRVHFSIDIDGCDPSEMPSTGTTSSGGLSVEILLNMVEEISKIKKVKSADLVEFNPYLGNDMQNCQTLNNSIKLIKLLNKIINS